MTHHLVRSTSTSLRRLRCPGIAALTFCWLALSIGIAPAAAPAADAGPRFDDVTDPERRARLERAAGATLVTTAAEGDASPMAAELGGEDELVFTPANQAEVYLDIASDGTIYVTTGLGIGASLIEVHRSTDGGETFQRWTSYDDPSTDRAQFLVDALLAEGTQDRLYVAYRTRYQIRVAWVDLGAASPTWNHAIALDEVGVQYEEARLATDAGAFSSYYLYLAADGVDDDGSDIWFTRSIDRGASWESPYRAVSYSATSDAGYYRPELSYGSGGYVHLGYQFSGVGFDPALFHRRIGNYADGGASAWSAQTVLDSANDGNFPTLNDVVASIADDTVLFYVTENRAAPDGNAELLWSSDAGVTWSPADRAPLPIIITNDVPLDLDPTDGSLWAMGTNDLDGHPPYEVSTVRTNVSDPASVSSRERWTIQEWDIINHWMDIARDPTRGGRRAVVWEVFRDGDSHIYFDAEWRRDPGRPIPDIGFPVPVSGGGNTPPAIAEVDGDAQQEIVFGTVGGGIHVLNHDGTYVDGWPVELGVTLPLDAPVAVGDLNGSGTPSIVTGTTDGRVFALNADGTMAEGWPVDLGTGTNAYVAIGALGPPFPRYVVATSDQTLRAYKYSGVDVSPLWGSPVNAFTFGPAIGDLDADGVGEIVVAQGSEWVRVQRLDSDEGIAFRRFAGVQFSGRPTLGDLDADGDLEIVVPATDGKVRVLHHDLSDYSTAFPYDTGSSGAIRSVSVVNLLGTTAPELVFAREDGEVHIVFADGDPGLNYPKSTGGPVYTPPVVGNVLGPSPDVLVSSGFSVYCWENLGAVPTGWPRTMAAPTEQSPALGDIDLDGRMEVVVLSFSQLDVFDVGSAPEPDPTWSWPMVGYDAQRTGCLDCTEDIVTSVDGPGDVPTQVFLASPHPNPTSSMAFFRYGLPGDAHVRLQVFDVRGRLVRTLVDGAEPAGRHERMWDGRNHDGRDVAQGVYLARLVVEGSGESIQQTRKVTLMR